MKISLQTKIMTVIGIGTVILGVALSILFVILMRSNAIDLRIDKSKALLALAEEIREQMAEKFQLGLVRDLREIKEKDKLIHVVPIFDAMDSMQNRTNEGNYIFRVPKFQPRNKDNEPDAFEANALRQMEKGNSNTFEAYDKEINAIRVFKSIQLTKECLLCHGDPATSKENWGRDDGRDVTGGVMEGWKVGERHGAFEIISPLAKLDKQINDAVLLVAGITAAIIALIMFLIWLVFRSIFKTVRQMAQGAQLVAEGDLRVEVPVRTKDEVGDLGLAFNEMTRKLSEVLQQVRMGSIEVSASAKEIALGNQDLAKRTEQQAASLEETSSSMEELSASVKANTTSAQDASRLAREADSRAREGVSVSSKVTEAMGAIRTSSDEIAKIVTLMNDISFQINLLALNASIEAARAGEQGRGFAVVAVEVRKLAGRSDEAAKQISSLIKSSTENVANGAQLVNQAGEALQAISLSIQQLGARVQEIAAASTEQAQGIQQIEEAVLDLDKNTQQNSALVEEASASTENLSGQAAELEELVKRFQVKSTEGATREIDGPARQALPAPKR